MLPLPTDTTPPPAPAVGLRDRKKQQVRDNLVEAALDLFAERGYDATTVHAVAERAQVSPATLARYFPTKESLLFSEREVRAPLLRQAILRRPAGEPPLRAVVRALIDQPPLDDRDRVRLVRRRQAIARSTVLRGGALALLDQWRDAVADAIAERDALTADQARTLATAVIAVLDDATARWAARGGHGDVRQAVVHAFDILDPPTSGSPQ